MLTNACGRTQPSVGKLAYPEARTVDRLKNATCYPATLTRTSLNDDRAPAWLALKFTAALQSSQSCAHPALLLAYPTGGHLGDRGPSAGKAVGIQVPSTKP